MDFESTVEMLVTRKMSFARFGDGELGLIGSSKNDEFSIGFQQNSVILGQRLTEILESEPDGRVMIGLPHFLKRMESKDSRISEKFWISQSYYLRKIIKVISKTSRIEFGDTQFSRIYMDKIRDEDTQQLFEKVQMIWEKKNVLIVEGVYTRFGVGNNLLANAESVNRILIPAKNAFNKYDEIYNSVLRVMEEFDYSNTVILVAGGPTATVLAYDIGKLGIQTVDIGHLDIEYEWYLKKTDAKISIPGKYVNEVTTGKTELQAYAGDDVLLEIKS